MTLTELKNSIFIYIHIKGHSISSISPVFKLLSVMFLRAGSKWAIIDWSGTLAHAIFNDEDGAGN
jgi:hypothetical protein